VGKAYVLGPFRGIYSFSGKLLLRSGSQLHPYDPPARDLLRHTVAVLRDDKGSIYLVYAGGDRRVLPFATQPPEGAREVRELRAGGRVVWHAKPGKNRVEVVGVDPVEAVIRSRAVNRRNTEAVLRALADWEEGPRGLLRDADRLKSSEYMCCTVVLARKGDHYYVAVPRHHHTLYRRFERSREAEEFHARLTKKLEPLRHLEFSPRDHAQEIIQSLPRWADAAVVVGAGETVVAYPAKESMRGNGYYYSPYWKPVWSCRCRWPRRGTQAYIVTRDGTVEEARVRPGTRYTTVEPVRKPWTRHHVNTSMEYE